MPRIIGDPAQRPRRSPRRPVYRIAQRSDASRDDLLFAVGPREPQRDVGFPFGQADVTRLRDRLQAELWMRGVEVPQCRDQQTIDDHGDCADADRACGRRVDTRGRSLQKIDLDLHALGALHSRLAGFGRNHRAFDAIEQLRSQAMLDPGDPTRDRRLVDAELPGGRRKGKCACAPPRGCDADRSN